MRAVEPVEEGDIKVIDMWEDSDGHQDWQDNTLSSARCQMC